MSIQIELVKWAKETADVYNPMAKTTGLGYYTQSVLDRETLNPDLLILGINPGAAGGGIMNGEKLLQGNPCFKGKSDKKIIDIFFNNYDASKRRYGWDLMRKIRKMLEFAGKHTLDNLDKFVLSNMVFFGTAKQGQIPKEIDQDACAKQTLDLIDLLKPKVVLLLGDQSRDLFKKNANIAHMDELIPGYHDFYCFYKGYHVISIYHTAYYAFFTNERMKVIGNILGYALDNPFICIDKQKVESYLAEIKNVNDTQVKKQANFLNKKSIVQQIISRISLIPYEVKNHRYKLNEKYGITITDSNKGYIGIRHINYDHKGYEIPQDKEVLALKEMLKERGYITTEKAWIGTKSIKDFGNKEDEIVKNIVSEINFIVEQVSHF